MGTMPGRMGGLVRWPDGHEDWRQHQPDLIRPIWLPSKRGTPQWVITSALPPLPGKSAAKRRRNQRLSLHILTRCARRSLPPSTNKPSIEDCAEHRDELPRCRLGPRP